MKKFKEWVSNREILEFETQSPEEPKSATDIIKEAIRSLLRIGNSPQVISIQAIRDAVGSAMTDAKFVETMMKMEKDALIDLTVHPESYLLGADDIRQQMPFQRGFADMAIVVPAKMRN
jgi:hypothetical protein